MFAEHSQHRSPGNSALTSLSTFNKILLAEGFWALDSPTIVPRSIRKSSSSHLQGHDRFIFSSITAAMVCQQVLFFSCSRCACDCDDCDRTIVRETSMAPVIGRRCQRAPANAAAVPLEEVLFYLAVLAAYLQESNGKEQILEAASKLRQSAKWTEKPALCAGCTGLQANVVRLCPCFEANSLIPPADRCRHRQDEDRSASAAFDKGSLGGLERLSSAAAGSLSCSSLPFP